MNLQVYFKAVHPEAPKLHGAEAPNLHFLSHRLQNLEFRVHLNAVQKRVHLNALNLFILSSRRFRSSLTGGCAELTGHPRPRDGRWLCSGQACQGSDPKSPPQLNPKPLNHKP